MVSRSRRQPEGVGAPESIGAAFLIGKQFLLMAFTPSAARARLPFTAASPRCF